MRINWLDRNPGIDLLSYETSVKQDSCVLEFNTMLLNDSQALHFCSVFVEIAFVFHEDVDEVDSGRYCSCCVRDNLV